jgi:hypothetical protein
MLEYTEQLYTAAEVDALKAELLERGWVTLPNVYQRHTVPEFRAAVLAAHSLGNLSSDLSQGGGDDTGLVVQPILAPRLMQFMPSAAGPEHPRGSSSQVSVFNIGVNVQGNPGEATPAPGNWHRDRGRAAWLPDGEPSFPEQVSVVVSRICVLHPPPRLSVDTRATPQCCAWTASGGGLPKVWPQAYFRDMVPGSGCTQILPRSHRLELARPDDDAGAHGGVEDFLPRMEDVVVWDQRAWHRRGPFTPQSEDDVRCRPTRQVLALLPLVVQP